ncbi:MAG: nitronate monooxygenase family protein [Candidatus Ancaeobacter aquaticus]|nr:nitronate monooxygenase family protein [Candidatus Ancaeobacter aquaticus]
MLDKLKPLIIGDLKINIPIFQGGMGIRVSTASLASAVAKCGAAGIISGVVLGYGTDLNETDFAQASIKGLQKEIRMAKEATDGPIGINILLAVSNYEDLVKIAVEEKADFLVTGAGLPLKLPELTEGSPIKLIPIVSSGRAAELIIKTWNKRYNRVPDAIVVEGPLAGGHLAFKSEDLKAGTAESLEDLVSDVLKPVKEYENSLGVSIPVIAAGGIFDGKDIARFIRLGASGVQIATRFVTTHECSVSEKFKQLYVDATKDDIVILDSPVGMPGRSIKTKFVEKIMNNEKISYKCPYHCLRACNPKIAPYCMTGALCNAVIGDIDNAVVFAGSEVHRINKIVSVKELIDELVTGANEELSKV